MSQVLVPTSVGELLDKITILQIKSERIPDESKLANVRKELEALTATWESLGLGSDEVASVVADLKKVNEKLWVIEDDIRDQEREGDFGDTFIELARSVYFTNDERAALKRRINELTGSELVEEKSYQDYSRD